MTWIIDKDGKKKQIKHGSPMNLHKERDKEQCVSCGKFEFGGSGLYKENKRAFFCWRDKCEKSGEKWLKE